MSDAAIAEARVLRKAQAFDRAEDALRTALALAPDNAVLHYELACTYDPQGKEQEAIPHYDRALALGLAGEDRRGALLGLGSSYRCVERYDDAVCTLRQGIEEFPQAEEFRLFLALALYSAGAHRDAMTVLLHHIANHSAQPDAVRFRRAIQFYADNPDPPYA